MATDLGFDKYGALDLEVQTNSSSALAICQRRGSGKIRHLEAGCLWIQAALANKRVQRLTKVPGKHNTADILTKGVPRADLVKHLATMLLQVRQSRAADIPQATAVERAAAA